MSEDKSAFIAAILEHPDDDAPRLVFADWLDEHDGDLPCRCNGTGMHRYMPDLSGEPNYSNSVGCSLCKGLGQVPNGFADRAAFIRVQVELARTKVWCPADPERMKGECPCTWHTLKRREQELLEPGFLKSLPWPFYRKGSECGFSIYGRYFSAVPVRGFINSVTSTAENCLAQLHEIMEWQPVQEVTLITYPSWAIIGRISRSQDDNYLQDMGRRWPTIKKWNLPDRRGNEQTHWFADGRNERYSILTPQVPIAREIHFARDAQGTPCYIRIGQDGRADRVVYDERRREWVDGW